jgi:HEAT repeat protein
MDRSYGLRLAVFVSCLGIGMASGCASSKSGSFWPWQKAPEETLPGVVPPHVRIEAMKQMREEAARATPERQQQVVDQLTQEIKRETDPLMRIEILRTLGEYRIPAAAPVLKAAINDPDIDARVMACEAWGRRGDAEAAAVLAGVLNGDVNIDVRLAAAKALGRIKDPAAVAALGNVLNDTDPAMQYRAVVSLQSVTGQNFGNDLQRWQQYVKGQTPKPAADESLAGRMRHAFQ